MGLGGISIWQLLIVLLIVVLLFGTKKLKSLGGDLGGALKGFKKALNEEDEKEQTAGNDSVRREELSPEERGQDSSGKQ